MDPAEASGNRERFSGFADLYDANRPVPPARLGPLLCRYARTAAPRIVDLGSGTGLSSRWAAGWAASVVGVEPNPDMRSQAELRPLDNLSYVAGLSNRTGLEAESADIVLAVQAMHWMEPDATLAEVARLLRPGGVFATVDGDWPPVCGVVAAEAAWMTIERRIRVIEARVARGDDPGAPITDGDPDLADHDHHDPHRNRAMPNAQRSWPKSSHLANIVGSGRFGYARELVLDAPIEGSGGAERFIGLKRSQGSYQGLRRLGLTDADIGMDAFERAVHDAFASAPGSPALTCSWRVRLGVVPGHPPG